MATKYSTGNPVGSSDPRDLFDNSIVIDEFANSSSETALDRRGVSRKTMTGLDAEFDASQVTRENEFDASQADKAQRFNQLLAASGYVFLDDYAAGIEITEYNEVIRDGSGNLWRAASTTTMPYTTDGTGLPEGGAFVSAGDAVLRNDLMDSLANGQGALNVRGSVIYVDTIADLQALPTGGLVDGQIGIIGSSAYKWDSAAAQWSSQQFVTPEAFGALGDGVSDDTQAVYDAISSGLDLCVANRYRIKISSAAGSPTLQDGQLMFGGGTLLGENVDASGQLPVLVLGNDSVCESISIGPYATNATYSDNTSYSQLDSDAEATFDYDQYIIGLEFGNNSSAIGVSVYNTWRGFTAGSKKNIKTIGCSLYQIGVWHTQYYDCDGVVFSGNTAIYGGEAGGVAFSSSKNVSVTGNYIKTVGTGINTGGSSAVGFNVENVSINGNTVIARDCINLENGCVNYTVSGNNVRVITNYDIPGTNGVAIGNTSGSSGSFQGLIGSGIISANLVSSYDSPFSYAIRVGTFETNSETLEKFTISDNICSGSAVGLLLHNDNGSTKIRHANITGNYFNTGSRGIRLTNVEQSACSGNTVVSGSTTTISNYFGITLDKYDSVECRNNKVSGYGYAFDLSSDGTNVSRCRLIGTEVLPNEQDQSASLGSLNLDGNFSTTSYFISGFNTISSTDDRLTLRSDFVDYAPGAATTISLIGNTSYEEGATITARFDGNVTIQHSDPFIILKGGVTAQPPNGESITFIAYDRNRVFEISRSY